MNTIDTNGVIVQHNPADMAKLYAKMARVMGKCKRVKKDGENKFHGYKYATAADVADEVRQYLAEENVAFFAEMGEKVIDDGVWVVTFYFTFACGDTGATKTMRWESEAAAMNKNGRDDKGLNKAATTAEKYFLLKTFILSAGDDPDADADGQQPQNRKQAQPPQAPRIVPKTDSTNALDVAGLPSANTNRPIPPTIENTLNDHWTKTPANVGKFFKWAGDEYELNTPKVLEILNVKAMSQYTGSYEDAQNAVTASRMPKASGQ